MECAEVNLHLGALLDRALPQELTDIVEGHVSVCQSCQSILEQLQSLTAVLRSEPAHTPSPALDERVMGAFRAKHSPKRATARKVVWWRGLFLGSVQVPKRALLGVGAVVVVALVAAYYFGRVVAPSVVVATPPQEQQAAPGPTVVEVPVERERIVYVRAPGWSGRSGTLRPRSVPASVDEIPRPSVSASITSFEDFEPIKGSAARVIEVSKER